MRLAIIPARGGSKRIPRKNIKDFCGKPMIAWPIAVAQQSACFDRIIVSTDDPEIAQVAKAQGAEVPFVRPPELSDDHVGTIPVIAHAIAWQNANGPQVKEACCIYATAPFLQVQDLQRGLQVLLRRRVDYAFSVASYAFPFNAQFASRLSSVLKCSSPSNLAHGLKIWRKPGTTLASSIGGKLVHGWQCNPYLTRVRHLLRYRDTGFKTLIPWKIGCVLSGYLEPCKLPWLFESGEAKIYSNYLVSNMKRDKTKNESHHHRWA